MSDNHKYTTSILKSFLCGILIGSVPLSITQMTAVAASSTSGYTLSDTVNGVNFAMKNTLYTGREGSDNHKYARAATSVQASQNLGGGYMGVLPVLYNYDGSVAQWGTWAYSSSGTSGISASTTKAYFTDSPIFSSWGYAEIWNGTDYNQYHPYQTPYLNDYT